MATAAQTTANQANALRSTGPITPQGKAASSRNATRHGLTATFCVLPHENADEFQELADALERALTASAVPMPARDTLISALKPKNRFERPGSPLARP